jgi:hypothetical protein
MGNGKLSVHRPSAIPCFMGFHFVFHESQPLRLRGRMSVDAAKVGQWRGLAKGFGKKKGGQAVLRNSISDYLCPNEITIIHKKI